MDSKPFAQLFKGLWITVLILAALLVSMGVMLSSCAGTRPEPVDVLSMLDTRVKTENPIFDSAKAVLPKKGLLPKLNFWVKKTSSFSTQGKFKNKGTIIIQNGDGNSTTQVDAKKADAPVQVGEANQATDNTKAGSKGGAAATAPNATATTSAKNGTPFLVYLLVFAAGFALRQFGPALLRLAVPALRLKLG